MKKQTKSNWQKQLIFASIAAGVLTFAASSFAVAQNVTYKSGDRVECDTTGTGRMYSKGTVMPFVKGDLPPGMEPDGSWYHFKADSNKVEYPCKPEFMRPLAGTAKVKSNDKVNAPAGTANTNETVAGNGNFLDCPIPQTKTKNGARLNAELAKKMVRCRKGEKAVDEGDEGAVKVEITSAEVGSPRPWSYAQDLGTGKAGTSVYPVKVAYTVKTFYRNATEVSDGWIRILNFYVNSFGEWEIGSEIPIKGGKFKRIEND